ncbi:unnamed protein product, partial [Pocillopora meandrina]
KFSIGDKLKQIKPGTREHELEFPGYPLDASLCVVVIIKEYLERTKHLRKGITMFGHHQPVQLHLLRYFLVPFSELLVGQDTAPLQ